MDEIVKKSILLAINYITLHVKEEALLLSIIKKKTITSYIFMIVGGIFYFWGTFLILYIFYIWIAKADLFLTSALITLGITIILGTVFFLVGVFIRKSVTRSLKKHEASRDFVRYIMKFIGDLYCANNRKSSSIKSAEEVSVK